MFSLFSNAKQDKRSIILDIQSGLVRGALISNQNHILSVVTKDILGKSHIVNAEHLTKKILKIIEEVIEGLLKDNGGHKITDINYILSTPWIFSKLKTIKIEYDKETEITSDILNKVIKEEVKSNISNPDIQLIDQKIFEIRLNGYPTVTYEGKKAHQLELSLSTSFSSKAFLDKVNTLIHKHVHIKEHTVHAALIAQYLVMRRLLATKNEYLYIHVHSELTDIIIVKDGLCRHLASFPFGINMLLRKIASESKESMESSDSALSLFQGNKLNDSEKESIKKAITPRIQEWSDLFKKSFENIFDVTSLPRTVYLSAHSHFDLFKQALNFQNQFNFEVIPYDSVEVGDDISFENDSAKSTMMKIYTRGIYQEI